jgi:hypothetical protein
VEKQNKVFFDLSTLGFRKGSLAFRPKSLAYWISPLGEMVNTADLKSAPFGVIGSSPIVGKKKE